MQEIESGEPAELEIEAPPGLLPDLSEWGIEEIERGVCEDTPENRKVIRSHKAQCRAVFDSNGNPTGLVQVITAEMHATAQSLSKANLLTDPENYNSDYLSGVKLLLASDAMSLAPTWVINATRTYIRQQDRIKELGADGELYRAQTRLVHVPTRCSVMKADGTRCWGWCNGAAEMLGMCRVHARRKNRALDTTMSTNQLMRNRLVSGSPDMLEKLEALSENEDARVALNAIRDWLDRAGYKAVEHVEQKVEVTVSESSDIVKERLEKLRRGQEEKEKLLKQIRDAHAAATANDDVVDAEVVDDES